MFPKSQIVESGTTEGDVIQLAGRVEYQFSVDYFKALAKIAFHYYLVHNQRGLSGHESQFSAIRSFVMQGGDPKQFFHSTNHAFETPFGQISNGHYRCPSTWCHLMAADETQNEIVVFMQFYIGPGYIPPPNYVILAPLPGKIQLPTSVWGHVYKIEQNRAGRYAGTMHQAQLYKLNRPL